MYDLAGDNLLDRDDLRVRLQRMSDEDLHKFGGAARYMCSPRANLGKPARQNFVIQLEEAIAEWKRRHPATELPESDPTV